LKYWLFLNEVTYCYGQGTESDSNPHGSQWYLWWSPKKMKYD